MSPHLPSPVHARSLVAGGAQNDSLGAFSLGNLKHRDLAGREVPSQLDLDQYDDEDEDDEDGEGEEAAEKEVAAEDDESATTSDNGDEDEMDL
jgi:hypothetical protein